jgi:hypothetical protein
VIRIDRHGNFTYANPEFIYTFQYGDKELIGSLPPPFIKDFNTPKLQKNAGEPLVNWQADN